MSRYCFIDTWDVPAPPEVVFDLLSRPRDYPSWWPDAFLSGAGDDGPAAPGKRARLVTRGRLPYRLRWELECVEATSPGHLRSRIRGDFEGEGTWTIEPSSGGTRAELRWDIEVRKPLVRRLTPLLRPVFAWNHRWAMRRGLARLTALLEGDATSAAERDQAVVKALAPVR